LLDHAQREMLLRLGRPAMGLALVAGAGMAAERLLVAGTASLTLHWLAFLAALPVAVYGLGMGANLVGGRFSRQPSSGAVDNGAAVAVLLDLARQLHRGSLGLHDTAITLLFTVGEETQMQGALAYVRCTYGPGREDWTLPTCAINLEVVGQDGGYLLWEEDGTAMHRLPADAALNRALARAVEAVTGKPPMRAPTINSDAFAFLRRGIPAVTLGSLDTQLGGRGFHSSLDAPGRVDPDRLAETTRVLVHLLAEMAKEAAYTSAG
jgi:Zn-dependent M28 family amino/carboxypeptidase